MDLPTPPSEHQRRILFIDAFDSFTNNIVGMLEECLEADITVVHINDKGVDEKFEEVLAAFDAVVVGPGPGHPANEKDTGFISKLWKLGRENLLPVLGICLGFQSMCMNHGAQIQKLRRARHGIVSSLAHQGTDIFEGIQGLEAAQYHSLHASINAEGAQEICWAPSDQCPLLQPLAWDDNDDINGPLLMGARHVNKPFWGVQFHPESICTSSGAKVLISNWWKQSQDWILRRNRYVLGKSNGPVVDGHPPITPPDSILVDTSPFVRDLLAVSGPGEAFLRWGKHTSSSVSPTQVVESLGLDKDDVVILDSQGHPRGRHSIVGLFVPGKTMKVTYEVGEKKLSYGTIADRMSSSQVDSIEEVWPLLQEALDAHKPRQAPELHLPSLNQHTSHRSSLDRFVAGRLPENSPFWGGFMGYISYEAGLETIDVPLHESAAHHTGVPDVNFAFIHRSIVIDHETSEVYVQSLLPDDWAWILQVGRVIGDHTSRSQIHPVSKTPDDHNTGEEKELNSLLAQAEVNRPVEAVYRDSVLQCKDSLAVGDSYELCLTSETTIKVPKVDPWSLYKKLRNNNPAPYGAFLRLPGMVVVGTSPERFLGWSRNGHCQFRPIKGTVKKGPGVTREMAEEILNSSKERAENLMIVDLIRHDLSGVVGARNVSVPKLMVLEEYETVYQLVSVIEGHIGASLEQAQVYQPRGMDVLKASLPPGSMTGAPKKRSCEILAGLERRRRGLYSGVLGYMDVGGAGDFSVVIRTAVQALNSGGDHRDKANNSGEGDTEVWKIGAGGAVTIQSSDEGEFLEMETKTSSVLGAIFRNVGD